ncbi:MAG: toprim domain-containing protein [Oceanospirillaceae bacterium]|nr:toprim domain-containing protein [Oceanospirillaceae bacterium]
MNSEVSLIDQFIAFAESKGLPLDQVDVLPDGQWHSFNDPEGSCSNSNARYILSDEPWSGAVGTHSGGWHCESWRPRGNSKLTSSQWNEIKQKQEQRKSEQEDKYDQAARRATKLYSGAVRASPSHPYLVRKGIKPHGLKQHGDDLLIPIYNLSHQIQTLQLIKSDGTKKLFPGGKKQGGFHVVGDWTSNFKLYVAEGWATAATVHEMTGEPCVCAVDCGNLEPAIATLKDWLTPIWEFCIAADNDWETAGNPGLTKALLAAAKHRTDLWYPPFTDADKGLSDWNDWHMKYNQETSND